MEKPYVLVVEEQNEITSLVTEIAASSDYDITTISNAIHLRKALVEHTFDIIIIDLFMSESDRFKLIIDLADIHCRSLLIFVSGEGDVILDVARKIAHAKRLNLIGLLNKPIQSELLKGFLSKAI
jgi:DNA-binding NtrC family response regulator